MKQCTDCPHPEHEPDMCMEMVERDRSYGDYTAAVRYQCACDVGPEED